MMLLPLLLMVVVFFFPFRAAIFYGSSWQTQSRLPSAFDGWRTEGQAFFDSFLIFGSDFSFFILCKWARFKECFNSIFNRRNVPVWRQWRGVGGCVCAPLVHVFEWVQANPFDTRRTNSATLLSVKYVTLLTPYLILLLMQRTVAEGIISNVGSCEHRDRLALCSIHRLSHPRGVCYSF